MNDRPRDAVTETAPSGAKDKTLFTPGPLTTSRTVKQAMLRDLGSRDFEFIGLVRRVRARLLEVAGTSQAGGYEAILMQGSGTFAVESMLSSTVPPDGKLLVVINGAYGERIAMMANVLKIDATALRYAEDVTPVADDVAEALQRDAAITHVVVVHCETTTGIVNPIADIGRVVQRFHKHYCVDAMSSYAAIPIDVEGSGIDYLVSSANKCLEGVPGIGLVLARRAALAATRGYGRSLSLDLHAQWQGLESNGQFRFTPPTHVLLALDQALNELAAEGGVPGRAARYRANYECLIAGMRALGFAEYLHPEQQGYIITSFRYPDHPRFGFEEFYDRLNRRGMVIYPGKVSRADCFRIGTIGRIFTADISNLLATIRDVMEDMGMSVPLG
jgi:2-aminoethylphosphonate-pyruvate transaminase